MVCPGGVSSTIATLGRSGPREIANPISREIAIGYRTSSAISRRERPRITRSLRSSHLIAAPPPPPGAFEEGDERPLEVPAVALPRLREQRPGSSVEQQAPAREHEHAVGVALRLTDVVGREHHRRTLGGQPRDEVPQSLPLGGVERGRRLVEGEHRRVGDQPEGDVHALAIPPDRFATRSPARSPRPVCASIRCDRRRRVGQTLEPREQLEVLGHRQLRVQGRVLRRPADVPRRSG